MALPDDNIQNPPDDTTDPEVVEPHGGTDAPGMPERAAGEGPAEEHVDDQVEEQESPDPVVAEDEIDGPVEAEEESPDPVVAEDQVNDPETGVDDPHVDADGQVGNIAPEEVVVPVHDVDGPGHDRVPHADEVLMPDVTAPVDPAEPGTDTPTGHDHMASTTAGRADTDGRSSRAPIVIGVVLLALAGLAAAFFLLRGGSDEPAYTAYEEAVSRTDLQARLDGLVDQELIEVVGDIEEATPEQKGQLARPISTLITEDVMSKAAADEGLEVTEADVDEQITEIVDQSFGGDRDAFDQAIEQRGASMTEVRTQFRTALLAEALIEDPESADPADEAAVQEFYDQQFAEPVVAHLLTETEEEAQQARERIEGGEEFAAVAQEVSIDVQSGQQGGRLGPLVEGQFVPEFEAAAQELEVGELSQPVETEFGYHIITLEAPPELDEVRDAIVQQLEQGDQSQKFAALGERLDEEAEVTVDLAFGTWTGLAEGGLVVEELTPPTGPPEDAPTE